jgi:hypothetical protein
MGALKIQTAGSKSCKRNRAPKNAFLTQPRTDPYLQSPSQKCWLARRVEVDHEEPRKRESLGLSRRSTLVRVVG